MYTPAANNLVLNTSGHSKLGFFVRRATPAAGGLPCPAPSGRASSSASPSGTIVCEPANATVLPNTADGWVLIEVPRAAGAGTRREGGRALSFSGRQKR
jgi:hypothetical protein